MIYCLTALTQRYCVPSPFRLSILMFPARQARLICATETREPRHAGWSRSFGSFEASLVGALPLPNRFASELSLERNLRRERMLTGMLFT